MTTKNQKFIAGLWGGIFIGVISSVPWLNAINCMCCSGVLGGGILSVYLYRQKIQNDSMLTANVGVELGIIAGVIGTVISTLLHILMFPVFKDVFLQKNKTHDRS